MCYLMPMVIRKVLSESRWQELDAVRGLVIGRDARTYVLGLVKSGRVDPEDDEEVLTAVRAAEILSKVEVAPTAELPRAQSRKERRRGAFFARVAEHETVAHIIARRRGLDAGRARWVAMTATTSPLPRTADDGTVFLPTRRGQPSINHDLYEVVNSLIKVNGPPPWRALTWKTFLPHWNAMHLQHRFSNGEALGKGYEAAARALEAKADLA